MSKKTVWVTGHHAVGAVITLSPERAVSLWVAINHKNQTQADLLDKANQLGIPIHPVDKRSLVKRSGTEQHQGIALEVVPKRDGNEQDLENFLAGVFEQNAPLLLILDQVQDPHNFGACLRTCLLYTSPSPRDA